MSLEEKYKAVFASVAETLGNLGYRGRAAVLSKDLGKVRILIDLQRSQSSSSSFIKFTVNMSVVIS